MSNVSGDKNNKKAHNSSHRNEISMEFNDSDEKHNHNKHIELRSDDKSMDDLVNIANKMLSDDYRVGHTKDSKKEKQPGLG